MRLLESRSHGKLRDKDRWRWQSHQMLRPTTTTTTSQFTETDRLTFKRLVYSTNSFPLLHTCQLSNIKRWTRLGRKLGYTIIEPATRWQDTNRDIRARFLSSKPLRCSTARTPGSTVLVSGLGGSRVHALWEC